MPDQVGGRSRSAAERLTRRSLIGMGAVAAVTTPAWAAPAGADPATGGITFLAPVRVLDTRLPGGRSGVAVPGQVQGPIGSGQYIELTLAGFAGVPASAKGIVANITVTDQNGDGYLNVYPADGTYRIDTSSLNFGPDGVARANGVTVGLGVGSRAGQLSIATAINRSSDMCNIVVDLLGYVTDVPGTAPDNKTVYDTYYSRLLTAAAAAKAPVGTSGKPAIALRFDDYQDALKSTVVALLQARALPWGHACISTPGAQPWFSQTTFADVKSWVDNGAEVWSHGTDHNDPRAADRNTTPVVGTPNGLYSQLKDSLAALAAQGFRVKGWMHPGATPAYAGDPYGMPGGFTSDTDLDTLFGQILMSTYGLSEGYIAGRWRNVPSSRRHGVSHITFNAASSLAAALDNVDVAISSGAGLEVMCHAGTLGSTGNLSLADFTTFLDYVVSKRDAGVIEVLTPSGLMLADKSTHRIDLIAAGEGGFEGLAVAGGVAGNWRNFVAGQTIETSGGHSGSNFLRMTNAVANQFVSTRPANLLSRELNGETFLLECWARSNGRATATARIVIQNNGDKTLLNLSKTFVVPAGWTRIRVPFSLNRATDAVVLGFGRAEGDGIDYDDISVLVV